MAGPITFVSALWQAVQVPFPSKSSCPFASNGSTGVSVVVSALYSTSFPYLSVSFLSPQFVTEIANAKTTIDFNICYILKLLV